MEWLPYTRCYSTCLRDAGMTQTWMDSPLVKIIIKEGSL